ncbi:hypothetical protein A9X04_03135 [Mycobacterium sp. E3247]|nr:hypothetical protein A9X04_03135 [Mycobacterium sp. E3247]
MSVAQQPVRSLSGTICVRTNERGLPVALHLDAVELNKPPERLAAEILALCRLSAARAQVARRRTLAEMGFGATAIRELHLASESDLARAEQDTFGDTETPTAARRSSL